MAIKRGGENSLLGGVITPVFHRSSSPSATTKNPQLPLAGAGSARLLAPPSGHGCVAVKPKPDPEPPPLADVGVTSAISRGGDVGVGLGRKIAPVFRRSFASLAPPSGHGRESTPLSQHEHAIVEQRSTPVFHRRFTSTSAAGDTLQLPLAVARRARRLTLPSGHGRTSTSAT